MRRGGRERRTTNDERVGRQGEDKERDNLGEDKRGEETEYK